MLTISNLSVSYGLHRALGSVSLRIDSGEIVVVLGANGAGKSSLLRVVAGVCKGRAEGNVELKGASLLGKQSHQIVEAGLAFVPEGRGSFGSLTVWENLMLGAYSKRGQLSKEQSLARTLELFPKLKDRRKQIVRTMSGGEQKMVALGRAMMANPDILMLDEPSLGLSPRLSAELFESLSHLKKSGMGVLLVEQNAKQSLAIADRGYLIENGRVTAENFAAALLEHPAIQAAYLGGTFAPKSVDSETS
jgi:branched-chain amino acid transport system ATP-binding protein